MFNTFNFSGFVTCNSQNLRKCLLHDDVLNTGKQRLSQFTFELHIMLVFIDTLQGWGDVQSKIFQILSTATCIIFKSMTRLLLVTCLLVKTCEVRKFGGTFSQRFGG